MSLLQFAKNNKEYLNSFSKLTDNDSSIRSETVESIIKQLNDKQTNINDIDQLQSSALIKYTLQRLIRGLTSSKHSNRIAFANTLSQVLTHCEWLSTTFVLETVNAFCENEKAKQSTIIESLLLIRNLFILILFQTNRLFELSWDDIHHIITQIVISKQPKNLIDLSSQSMICLLNIIEQNNTDNDDSTNLYKFKSLLIKHRSELVKTFSKLIPFPINSFKLISITQIKLILRMYSDNHQFTSHWTLDNVENKTIQIFPTKIGLIYEFLLKPLKKSESSLASMMNIYNDDKMWSALITLYCNEEDKEQRNRKFGRCCDGLFYFVNQNMLKPKYVSFVSILCDAFIRCGISLSISSDTLFTHILHPAILRFITKYGFKYKNQQQNKEYIPYKRAFDFMMELKLLTKHQVYGARIKSILISSSSNIGRIETDGKDEADDNDSKLKTIKFYEKVFWRSNGFIHNNKTKYRNQLLSSERDCVTSIKAISNVLLEYIRHNGKRSQDKGKSVLKYIDIQWIKEAVRFLVRIVFFRSNTDIFNKSRFETILLTAKKLLRILLQASWNLLPSNDDNDTLNKSVWIGYFNQVIELFKEDDALSYRSKNIMAFDAVQMSLKGIMTITNKMDKINKKYLSKEQKILLSDLVRFIGVYYYMESSMSVTFLSRLNDNIIDNIDELESIAFGSSVMDIVIECVQSDDILISCLSRHMFLEFGDLYNSNAFNKLLQFVSQKEDEEIVDEDDEKDDDIDMKDEDEDVFMNDDDDDDEDSDDDDDEDEEEEDSDESSSDSDEFDITDYGAFARNNDDDDIDLEAQTVKSEELEQMDQALIAVFREKQKQTETRKNAKESRIQKRVFHHLLLFVKQYKTSPILLIMFPPLIEYLWKLFDQVTNEYQKAKNKQNRKHNKDDEKVKKTMHTVNGVPLWRFDNKLKRSWNDYTAMLHKKSKKENNEDVVSTKSKNFHATVAVINGILVNSPKLMIEADTKYDEIKVEWIKDILRDIIPLISESPTYEHEMLGVKVLCYLCKIYELKCGAMNQIQIWNDVDLNSDHDDDEEEMKHNILWLFELWYFQLKLLLKQPRRIWYFSREFFDVLMRKNAFIAWKLIYEALNAFELCKNSWSQTQLFVLIGNVSSYCNVGDDELIECVLSGIAKRMITPLKESLSKSMDPTKKMLIAQNAGKFVRKLNKYKIDGKEKKEILNALGNSKLQWKKIKTNTKKKYKKSKDKKKSGNKNKKSYKSKDKKNKKKNNERKRKMALKSINTNSTNTNKKRKLK